MADKLPINYSAIPSGLFDIPLWQRFEENCSAEQLQLLASYLTDPQKNSDTAKMWAASHYIADASAAAPVYIIELLLSGDLERSYSEAEFEQRLTQRIAEATSVDGLDFDNLSRTLRRFRRREISRIIGRDLLKKSHTIETVRDMTFMAESCIKQAYDFIYPRLCEKHGTPIGKVSGQAQHMVVLGMGKLGAYELNVSSDIDLIFTYPEAGETRGQEKIISNQEFFIFLSHQLIKALDLVTVDGFVFRVDMRLRPYGESGALVLSFDAMEEYYQSQGREWERYALIKARHIGRENSHGTELLEILQPFVYRRYIDFSVVDALRSMKTMIEREVRRKGTQHNIKLGYGGIREIEFIAQCIQLIRGGRDMQLQQRSLLTVLDSIAEKELLPSGSIDELKQAYFFLRDVEHILQGFKDQQTQMLPKDSNGQLRTAWLMGFASWADFIAVLKQHRALVSGHFSAFIADPNEKHIGSNIDALWSELWESIETADSLDPRFVAQGYDDPARVFNELKTTRQSIIKKVGQTEGRVRIDKFMPLLLAAVAQLANSSETLSRLLRFVESVSRRTSYLVLLLENPPALQKLVSLFAVSPWIAEQLTQYPILLDELLHAGLYQTPPSRTELADELRQQILRIPEDDQEEQMDTLRYFKMAHVLNVAASEIAGTLPLMKVSDYLTFTAEVILNEIVQLAWRQMTAKYGCPVQQMVLQQTVLQQTAQPEGPVIEPNIAVIGYGKVGGIELGYSSDLDLVFVGGADPNGSTDGANCISNRLFYLRVAQRIVHILHTHTSLGQLYEVDTRLRPDGNAGELVCSIKAFRDYQLKNAWTWEHQALVRARPVAGNLAVGEEFNAVRREVLSQQRNIAELRHQVDDMREKMVTHLGSKSSKSLKNEIFHLKQDPGGIVDIEFMVQYAVLAWAHRYPSLVQYTDNIRILEALQKEELFTPQESQELIEAYKHYRVMGHRLALQQQTLQKTSNTIAAAEFDESRKMVRNLWQKLLRDEKLRDDK